MEEDDPDTELGVREEGQTRAPFSPGALLDPIDGVAPGYGFESQLFPSRDPHIAKPEILTLHGKGHGAGRLVEEEDHEDASVDADMPVSDRSDRVLVARVRHQDGPVLDRKVLQVERRGTVVVVLVLREQVLGQEVDRRALVAGGDDDDIGGEHRLVAVVATLGPALAFDELDALARDLLRVAALVRNLALADVLQKLVVDNRRTAVLEAQYSILTALVL